MQRTIILQTVPNLAVVLRWWWSTELQRKSCSTFLTKCLWFSMMPLLFSLCMCV